ncbi:ABC transporter permease [Allokutzneria sp. A3M-2-11 16]|uniref:ABC transporter permease n=1 Tax=Allokutzneria sp. A3M-2-11 16 TaxID=2962043 RepID=UPI0020B63BA5|nr:ABC transporter permease [Allokutzneria sp. A3M-2-11 16]MCP3804161.1 ABC transporter permease [Allokutzneria sp. A3M-2-11 16]
MRRLRSAASGWIVLLVLVVLWETATRIAGSLYFPPPSQIAETARQMWFSGPVSSLFLTDVVFEDLFASVARMLGGWAIAGVLGVALGVLLGRSATAMDYCGPIISFLRAIPPPTLVPVFLALFTLGTPMQLATIVFGTIWPILLNSVDGARSVDETKTETARAFRVSTVDWIFGVVLPAASPKIFAGLRISLSLSLVLMVISELVGSTEGIGYRLLYSQRQYDFPAMWASIVLLGVLGFLFNTGLSAIERRVLAWQPAHRQAALAAGTGA